MTPLGWSWNLLVSCGGWHGWFLRHVCGYLWLGRLVVKNADRVKASTNLNWRTWSTIPSSGNMQKPWEKIHFVHLDLMQSICNIANRNCECGNPFKIQFGSLLGRIHGWFRQRCCFLEDTLWQWHYFSGQHATKKWYKMLLEPNWPLFLKVNPPKQGLFQSKQGSFRF